MYSLLVSLSGVIYDEWLQNQRWITATRFSDGLWQDLGTFPHSPLSQRLLELHHLRDVIELNCVHSHSLQLLRLLERSWWSIKCYWTILSLDCHYIPIQRQLFTPYGRYGWQKLGEKETSMTLEQENHTEIQKKMLSLFK